MAGESKIKLNPTKAAEDKQPEKEVLSEKEAKRAERKAAREALNTFDPNTQVLVASRVKGGLTYVSEHSKLTWRFSDFDDQQLMPFSELRNMMSGQKTFFTRGWLQILDEDAVKALNAERYENDILDEFDVEDFFESDPNDAIAYLERASKNNKRVIFGFAQQKLNEGELTDYRLIKAIEDTLGEKLNPRG